MFLKNEKTVMLAVALCHTSVYLSAGNVHPGGVKAVFDLSRVVYLKDIISTELHIIGQLAVLKEVHHERHLAHRST